MTSLLRHEAKQEEEEFSSSAYVNSSNKTLKVAILREEFVALTHDPLIAIVLNQLLYWSQRVSDFDLLMIEENSPALKNKKIYGWFYKSAQELIEETMVHVSKVTMRRYLHFLVEKRWLEERGNPQYKWDKTTQYRLNLRQLQYDLQTVGRSLPGFPADLFLPQSSKRSCDETNSKNPKKSRESKNEASKLSPSTFEGKENASSKRKKCSFIPETTTKITNKDHTHCVHKNLSVDPDQLPLSMIECWQKHIGQEGIQLSKKRSVHLNSLLNLHFQGDLLKWEEFCKRIKESPFLMGEGPNKWHVTFNWILLKGNIIKILEGNYDSPETIKRKKEVKAKDFRKQKNKEILESIEDPHWKDWCDQLSEFPQNGYSPVNKPLYWWELERVKNAKFLDFDGRLVTLGSSDSKVLNAIENNRFQISSVVSRTFPASRGIRTELIPTQKDLSLVLGQGGDELEALGDKTYA